MDDRPTSGSLSSTRTVHPQPPQRPVDLPDGYGETVLALMPRDPWWCYCYWELAAAALERARAEFGDNLTFALRVYDVTDVEGFNGANARAHFDVRVDAHARSWYINVPEVNRAWCADLGLLLADGRFVTLARSNVVRMPRFGVSRLTDEQWAVIQREFDKLLELSGIEGVGSSSFDIARLMKERWEELMAISQVPPSSGAVSSFRIPGEAPAAGFFLRADTELIVYGETAPDATLYVQGEKYALGSDGRFSLRMHLPDGVQHIPIAAVSADGTMRKEIAFTVTRVSQRNG